MALPVHRSRAEDVVAYVEDAIEQRGLRPGDHIGTRAGLRDETGVARATINEAIRLLQERQRIVVRHRERVDAILAGDVAAAQQAAEAHRHPG